MLFRNVLLVMEKRLTHGKSNHGLYQVLDYLLLLLKDNKTFINPTDKVTLDQETVHAEIENHIAFSFNVS